MHASNEARFIEAYQNMAKTAGVPGYRTPKVAILQLVSRWLSRGRTGCWLLMIDNANDSHVFFHWVDEENGIVDGEQDNQHPLSFYSP